MIFSLQDLDELSVVQNYIDDLRKKRKTIGLTSGCFDLIHFHHFNFFLRCRRYCDVLIVGIDADELVRNDKGATRPIIPDFKRAIMVDGLRPVNFTFIMSGLHDFRMVAKQFRPNTIFKNDQFRGKENKVAGREFADKVVILHDQTDHSSTSGIIEHLTSMEIRKAK
jgi:cytidyltransferase-like protein